MNEIAPNLYHGSRKEFPVDFVLTPQNDGYVNDPEVSVTEKIMEKFRPEGHLSRRDSIFMVDDPDDIDNAGGYLAYIYKVAPIGSIEKNDLAWYSDLSIYAPYNELDDELIQSAKNYWSGISHPENSLMEYRAKSAKIIEIVEINPDEM